MKKNEKKRLEPHHFTKFGFSTHNSKMACAKKIVIKLCEIHLGMVKMPPIGTPITNWNINIIQKLLTNTIRIKKPSQPMR